MAFESLDDALDQGMALAFHAGQRPDNLAVASRYGDRSFAELNGRVNQLARLLREHDIGAGDAIAVVTRNRPEFLETYYAAMRTGVRVTPVNWHLTGEEAGYVIDNCEAKAVVYDAGLGTAAEAAQHARNCSLRLVVGGRVPGFDDLDAALADFQVEDIDDPQRGSSMLYTSGTTGRPKGVYRRDQPVQRSDSQQRASGDPVSDRNLCTGPAYHAAPLVFNVVAPLNAGVGVVMMDKWDAEETLRLIEEYGITHTHMVATMFHRLLQLPEETRRAYDLSSLKFVIHGAAPCPVHVKHAIIEWFGPIIWEYYAATEGGNNFLIDSETWLQKPGSVGRLPDPESTRILDDDGTDLAQGESGFIYFRAPEVGRFEYFKAAEKTAGSYRGDWFTLGDMGYIDEDGFLFLNGRSAETIISGGVNIYPQEIDEELLKHPEVLDVCTVGVPNDEWGEEVKSVVQLRPESNASDELAESIMAFARDRLPGFKCPRSVDFADELPRLPSGKIQRRHVRGPYWEGRDRQI
ncbi:MAG: AMP-binding protein [Gammaproteobacteria bacterium]|nr:AMP-binding protein [Gammaproteobacteria bacterium]